jgi:CarD family transcriptional regulator
MYNIGDLIIYSSHGICRIDDICEKTYSGMTQNYYVIHPIEDDNLTINAPVELVNKTMVEIMNHSEALEIIESFKQPGIMWIDKAMDRTKSFTEIIKSGKRKEISMLLNTLMRKKNEFESTDKKLSDPDRRLLLWIQSILFKELSIALDITIEEVVQKVEGIILAN